MEGLDSNPFQDPFEDSSVNQARAGSKTPENEDQLTDFNPFSNEDQNKVTQLPAVIQPSDSAATTTTYQQQTEAQEALKKQQEELEKKAEELEKREQRMNQGVIGAENNFPPLPTCCPLKPCFHQDINMDIPQRFQPIVRQHFILWIAFSCTMTLNLVAALSNILVASNGNSGTSFGLSILYLLLFPPLAYVFCFRSVYKAFKNDSSINYFTYFICFSIHNCIMVVWCIGIPGSGGVGFISGIATASESNSGVGVFMVVVGVMFVLNASVGFMFTIKVLRYYRNTDASFQQAQQEFTSGVFSNKTVRQAATTAVANSFAENPAPSDRY